MSRLFIVLCLITLMGAGCRKPTATTVTPTPTKTPAPTITKEQVARDFIPREEYEASNPSTLYTKQALHNLQSAQSFSSRIRIPGTGQDVTAELQFVKDQGLRGILQIPGESGLSVSEVYLSKQEVFVRAGNSPWQNISGTTEALDLIESLHGTFAFEDEGDFILNGSEAFIGSQKNNECTAHQFRQVTSEGMLQTFSVCITSQDLPLWIEIDTKSERPIRIDYSRINEISTIEKPQL